MHAGSFMHIVFFHPGQIHKLQNKIHSDSIISKVVKDLCCPCDLTCVFNNFILVSNLNDVINKVILVNYRQKIWLWLQMFTFSNSCIDKLKNCFCFSLKI